MNNNYDLLKNKDIIAILDGDTELGEYKEIKLRLPYLSGPDICSLSQTFGFFQEYSWSGGALSRWAYMNNLLEYCIKENAFSNLLSYMTTKQRFQKNFVGMSVCEIEEAYSLTIQKMLESINSFLYFGGHELIIVSNQFLVKKIGTKVEINTPNIKVINVEYIKDLSSRALKDIEEYNYDSAITKSRTIVEETFCYAIEIKKENPTETGEISKLYKQVKDLYSMHANKGIDVRINTLLSGLEKIISAIAEMRNTGSDSHGLGSKRINIESHHARLFVNSSVTIAEFILSIAQNSISIN